MDFGCGVGGSGGDVNSQGYPGSEGLKRKWSDLEASMKAVKEKAEKSAKIHQLMQDNVRLEKTALYDLEALMKVMKEAIVKENAEKSAKIRRLMEDNVRLEETVLRLEKPSSFRGPCRPMPRPNPFAVLPAEVWELIIEKMGRASDLEVLCLAFPQLEPSVKKKKKTLFLFEKVLPFVREHLELEDINNCRLVCEKWNRDVCALLANWNAPNLLPETGKSPVPDCPIPFSVQIAYTFPNHQKIQKFIMKMADHPGNPLFGRFIRLSVCNRSRSEIEKFWKSALELVKKFGEHVWNLEIDCFHDQADPIAFYKALQETLIHLPNLRYLSIVAYCDLYCDEPSHTNIAPQIWSSPLPPLPYLQSLKLALRSETGMISAFSSLFSPRIRRLELFENDFGSVELKDERLRGVINLEHLEVYLKSTEDILRLLKFPASKLTKLCLHSGSHPDPPVSINSRQLGNLLGKFSRLEYLDISLCRVVSKSSLSSEMRFPRLETLEISVSVNGDDLRENLDFLLWFPSLKHLKFTRHTVGRKLLNLDQHSSLKIRNFLNTRQMLDSNVWTLVPSLESLEIWGGRDGKYTREMFENRKG